MKNRQARVVLNRLPEEYLKNLEFKSKDDRNMVQKAIDDLNKRQVRVRLRKLPVKVDSDSEGYEFTERGKKEN